MTNYKNLLLALGITVVGAEIADAEVPDVGDSSALEDMVKKTSSTMRTMPSPVFLDVKVDEDIAQDDFNAGCSVSNSGCAK